MKSYIENLDYDFITNFGKIISRKFFNRSDFFVEKQENAWFLIFSKNGEYVKRINIFNFDILCSSNNSFESEMNSIWRYMMCNRFGKEYLKDLKKYKQLVKETQLKENYKSLKKDISKLKNDRDIF